MSLSDDTTMEVLRGLRRRVDVEAASRLRLDDDIVYTVVFRRLHDGVPFVLTTVHLAPTVAAAVLGFAELADGAVGTQTMIGCSNRISAQPIAKPHNRSRSHRPIRWSPMRSAASRAIRCCGSTGCIPTPTADPSSCPSAISCPSSTPTG